MAGRSARVRQTAHELDSVSAQARIQGRALSLSNDTPRPSGTVLFQGLTSSPSQDTLMSTHSAANTSSEQNHHKRLGFLGDMLLSSASSSSASTLRGGASNHMSTSRSHTRADSTNLLRDSAASPSLGMSSSSGLHLKGHPSPSKIVSREMHRLGNFAHLPGLNPSISAPSTVALNVSAQPSTMSVSTATGDTPWPVLHQYILPLFNGESLRKPIEDLNTLVKRHIQTVVSSTPSKALAMLENDTTELIVNGMVTLSTKLNGVDSERILLKVVEIWVFFWGQVLPYVEGALLPLQTEPILSSLYRMPKGKPTSPGAMGQSSKNATTSTYKSQQIDVRTIALQSFRDHIVLPAYPILHERLTAMREESPGGIQQPRLQQMLLVLISQRSLPMTYSLTAPPPPPPPGEEAVTLLLREIRTPLLPIRPQHDSATRKHLFAGTGAPSFLSAGLPRDRRGRIAQKPERHGLFHSFTNGQMSADAEGDETPRIGTAFSADPEPAREKEREFLESLRSPDNPDPENARASMGGWGLGDGQGGEDTQKTDLDEEDEENLENLGWDKTQAVVERMVGMKV